MFFQAENAPKPFSELTMQPMLPDLFVV